MPLKTTLLRISFFVLLVFLSLACAAPLGAEPPFPKPRGLINDFANVIPQSTEQKMAALAAEVLKKTHTSVVVVTMPDIGGAEYNDYVNRLYAAWGIGKKGEEKGVLIFVTIKERKMRIETGYGMEGILPDGLVGEIRDKTMVPFLRDNKFGEGLLNGTMAVSQVIAKKAGVRLSGLVPVQQPKKKRSSGLSFFPILLIILIFMFSSRRRGGSWIFFLPLLMGGGQGSRHGGFGGGFGGFGGGFGGFGGGMSGGGGAGGSF
ncbi:MAG: TPM domain-containing protein [Pseudomonadota bacterium]